MSKKNNNYTKPITEEPVLEAVEEVKEEVAKPKKKIKGTVIPAKLNVRKEASVTSAIVLVIDAGTVLDLEEEPKGEWVRIEKLGGFVKAEFLKIK